MSKPKKILIATSTFGLLSKDPIDKLVNNGFEVIKNTFGRKLTREELLGLLPQVDGLIAGLENLSREVLASSSLKVVSRCGAGMDNIDLAAADDLGIRVFSTPDAPTNSVAELTIGVMISLARHISEMDLALHNGQWAKKNGIELKACTIAIIGFGRIGQRVAELLKAFKSKIIVIDPNYKGKIKGFPVLSLVDALPKSDIITIHAGGNTVIFGKKEFSLIKNGVFLMNCARGKMIDEVELIHALDSGRVAGAWLDCFPDEPYSGPLIKYPQVVITPHIGSYTRECRTQMEMEAVNNLIEGFSQGKII